MIYRKGVKQRINNKKSALDKIFTQKTELFKKKMLEQNAFITKPKIEELMLLVFDKFTHEEHLSQQIQIINIYFTKAVIF